MWQAAAVELEPVGSAQRVYSGILEDLETGLMVPGQRLVETDLAQAFGVGRNAVREAMQHLAARGVVDLSPNRSPAIRRMDLAECLEVLDVASVMTGLVARAAAVAYAAKHAAMLESTLDDLAAAEAADTPVPFSRARRHFYRALLVVGGNRELQRLFPAIGMQIIHAQYPHSRIQAARRVDYRMIAAAVMAKDAAAAEAAAVAHVEKVRAVLLDSPGGRSLPLSPRGMDLGGEGFAVPDGMAGRQTVGSFDHGRDRQLDKE